MEQITAELDPRQRAAVEHSGSPLLVTGPAGSGRTTVLIERFAHLVESGIAPERILVLTRTDAQADLLRPRLEEKLRLPWEELSVHGATGLAARILARATMEIGLDPEVGVLSSADRLALLGDAMDSLTLEAHDLGRDPMVVIGTLIERIDRLEEELITAAAFAEWAAALEPATGGPDPVREQEFAQVWLAHDRLLAERGARSAAGLVADAVGLLQRNPALREEFGSQWDEAIVDGIEDFDAGAWQLLRVIALEPGAAPQLAALTNPAEGSRRLRGAFTANAEALIAARPDTTLIELDAPHREPSEVEFWQATNERAQAQAIAADVERLVLKEGVPANRIAVVVENPTREAQAIEVALEERAMPNRVNSGQAFFQRGEIRDLLAWLRLLVDPADGAAVARALARPPISVGSADIASCSKIARRRKIDLVAGVRAATESPQVPPEARERLHGFLKLHGLATQAIDMLRPDLFVHRLIERLGLRASLAYSASPQAAERLRALAAFGEIAAAHVRRDPQATARDFARHITAIARAGFADIGVSLPPGDYPAVEILGLDALRDREWDHVFIAGLDAGRSASLGRQPAEPLPAALLPEDLPDLNPNLPDMVSRNLLRNAVAKAGTRAILCHSRTGSRGDALHPSPWAEDIRLERGADWVERETELFAPGESLEATYQVMRDELLEVIEATGSSMLELKLDTGDEVDAAVVKFLELLKIAALAGRPDGHAANESLAAVNDRLRSAATDTQRMALESSGLDRWITDADAGSRDRARALAARSEPSLTAFLPRSGDGLALSAGDLETYRTCPLRYKFARVMRVPQDPTVAQRFGIVVHQVLERWHRGDGGGEQQLLELLDRSWRRSGLGDGQRERQLKVKARDALVRYHARDGERNAEAKWLERGFAFKVGPHTVRGRVDRVDLRDDGEYELIDYKTSFPKTVDELRDDIQLTIYSIGASDAWDLDAVRRSYWYVLDDDRVEVPGGVDRATMEATVFEVAEGIIGQEFEPTPSWSACSWCDWRLACPAAER